EALCGPLLGGAEGRARGEQDEGRAARQAGGREGPARAILGVRRDRKQRRGRGGGGGLGGGEGGGVAPRAVGAGGRGRGARAGGASGRSTACVRRGERKSAA